jgi:hypothetical protein
MKSNKIIVIIINILSSLAYRCTSSKDDIALLSAVIEDISQEFFIKKSIEFDIIIFGEPTNHLNDIACKFIEQVS